MPHLPKIAILLALSVASAPVSADETDARRILQTMSDYLAGLDSFAFDYDSTHEIVTSDGEKIGLSQSGTVAVARPDRVHATRVGGFTDLEMAFDGATFAVSDGDTGLRSSTPINGDIDALVDALRDTYGRPLPAADLVVSDPFPTLMQDVMEVKDLGSGVVGGVECDHLALRGAEVDWQIWIAQGETPRPCLFVITSRDVDKAPQYRIMFLDWREAAGEAAFARVRSDGTTEVDMETFAASAPTFPENFSLESKQ